MNEELDEIRELRSSGAPPDVWRPKREHARAPIEAKRAEHEAEVQELSNRWDATLSSGDHAADRREILEGLRERVLERSYINNLLDERAFLSVENLASFILLRLSGTGNGFEVFLVADQEQVSTPEFVERLARAADLKPRMFSLPTPLLNALLTISGQPEAYESLIGSLKLDLSKAASTGWRTVHSRHSTRSPLNPRSFAASRSAGRSPSRWHIATPNGCAA